MSLMNDHSALQILELMRGWHEWRFAMAVTHRRKKNPMANLRYVQPNRLRREVDLYHRRLLSITVPLLALMAWIQPMLFGLGFLMLMLLWSHQNHRLSGAEGEDWALGVPAALPGSLTTLPDGYTVFNQVIVPNGKSSRELDFVVVGPNGIFAIEVKHHRGEISGKETNITWRQRKRSRAGNTYEQDMRNPVGQIKGAIHALKQYLKAQDINPWIQGIVVFTHPQCTLSLGEMSVPVLRLESLAAFIRDYRGNESQTRMGTVIRVLKGTREERLKPPYPQHVSYFMKDFVTPRERVEGIMNYDLKAAMKRQAKKKAFLPSPTVPTVVAPPRPPRRRRPVLAVIENHQHLPPDVRQVVREFTLYVRRTEKETVVQSDDWFG